MISNVRRSSQIPVLGCIRFDWWIVPVNCNPTDFRSIGLQRGCCSTDFHIGRFTMSVRSDRFEIGFKYYHARLDRV